MRQHRWGQILPGVAGAVFAVAEAGREVLPAVPSLPTAGLPGQARYADAHEFDRRAIATFLTSPQYPHKPASLALLYSVRHPTLDVSVVTARSDLIKHWDQPVAAGALHASRAAAVPLAGRYVDARGYDCQVLVDIAAHLEAALDGTGLDAIADRVDQPWRQQENARRTDALDRVIDCLHARLTAAEITTALDTGTWPDQTVLQVMAALAP